IYSYERPPTELPDEMLARMRADAAAWDRWEAEQPSFRRTASHWITSAKKAETRERRFNELLDALRNGTRPRPFLVERAAREPAGR
ncbi:MAG TPA: YdeI/OmpD-associated family protein, partial [Candidatus Limnocylindria bacterium]|nr:YdeI/OmpD-associated family protein [Candidatus Limnocylindria bacterium]